jgi:ribose 5-phosphate isomerase A
MGQRRGAATCASKGGVSPVEPFASLRWPLDIPELSARRGVAATAADWVRSALAESGTALPRIGLGSGSTSFLTLLALAGMRNLLPPHLTIVATSYEMEWYAKAAGFVVQDLADADAEVAVAFDGADQVDPSGAMVKGRGGAMHRERAVLGAARRELIVADATKRVTSLGGCPLPLVLRPGEIFETVDGIEALGVGSVTLRSGSGKDGPVLTESGGILADLEVSEGVPVTGRLDARLRAVPGVLDTGYFPPSPKRQFVHGMRDVGQPG